MNLPPPTTVVGRLIRTVVARPYDVLRPFLTEGSSPAEGLLGELLTIVAGLLAFAVVSLSVALAGVASLLYAVGYALVALPARLLAAVRGG